MYEDELKYFSKALIEQRLNKNVSQYKLGQICELNSNTGYKRLESNGNASLLTLLKLSKNLGVDIQIKNGKVFVFD